MGFACSLATAKPEKPLTFFSYLIVLHTIEANAYLTRLLFEACENEIGL